MTSIRNDDGLAVQRSPTKPRRPLRIALYVLACALFIGGLEAIQAYIGSGLRGRPIGWMGAFAATLPTWLIMALLVPGVVWTARRFPLRRGRLPSALAAHFGASLVFALLYLGAATWLTDFVLAATPPDRSFETYFSLFASRFFIIGMSYYGAIVGIVHAWDYQALARKHGEEAMRLALRAAQLQGSLARANLEALRMQLQPHFLFNTLNSLSVLASEGETSIVERMLVRLSDLLRITLDNTSQTVPLRRELEILKKYVEIERVRFGDRLDFVLDVPSSALDVDVPTLITQPLVENAVRHGIGRRPGRGTVVVTAAVSAGTLRIEVRDRALESAGSELLGVPNAPAAEGFGVGLSNTRERLARLYGRKAGLEFVEDPHGATVRIALPAEISARGPEPPVAEASRSDGSTAADRVALLGSFD